MKSWVLAVGLVAASFVPAFAQAVDDDDKRGAYSDPRRKGPPAPPPGYNDQDDDDDDRPPPAKKYSGPPPTNKYSGPQPPPGYNDQDDDDDRPPPAKKYSGPPPTNKYSGPQPPPGYNDQDDDDDRPPPANKYSWPPPSPGKKYSGPPPVSPPGKYSGPPPTGQNCVRSEQVRQRLTEMGWQDFHGGQQRGDLVSMKARRPSGRLFELTLHRCTGQIVEVRPLEARPPGGPYAFNRPYDNDRNDRPPFRGPNWNDDRWRDGPYAYSGPRRWWWRD